jgi:hypothetical protein
VTRPRSARAVFGHAPRGSLGGGGGGAESAVGPSSYEPLGALGTTRPSSARAVFGRAERSGSAGRSRPTTPGPDAYDFARAELVASSRHVVAPRQRIGSAARDRGLGAAGTAADAPAPNAYVLDLGEVKPRAPRARIGTAPRDALAQRPARAAGPASYTPDEARLSRHAAAPRARIGSAGRFPGASSIAAASPGPAYYATIDALPAHVEGGVIGAASRERPRSAGRALAGGGGDLPADKAPRDSPEGLASRAARARLGVGRAMLEHRTERAEAPSRQRMRVRPRRRSRTRSGARRLL